MDKGSCGPLGMVAWILLIIGGLNWGLVGIGGFAETNLDVVNLLLSSMPTLMYIVYILVGLSAVWALFACKK